MSDDEDEDLIREESDSFSETEEENESGESLC